MSETIVSKEIVPNMLQGQQTYEGTPVIVQAKNEEAFPNGLTRLSKKKVKYLITGITHIKQSDRVLELFGGTNASTTVIKEVSKPKELVSVDLHNSLSPRALWKYLPSENYRRQRTQKKGIPPPFIAADAAHLPFADEVFNVVVAPDSPRSGAERIDETMDAGSESPLSFVDQQTLFKGTSSEAYRVLTFGGEYVGTAPLSWVQNLANAGFKNIHLLSHADLPGVTKIQIGRDLQFKIQGTKDPVVYFKCVK